MKKEKTPKRKPAISGLKERLFIRPIAQEFEEANYKLSEFKSHLDSTGSKKKVSFVCNILEPSSSSTGVENCSQVSTQHEYISTTLVSQSKGEQTLTDSSSRAPLNENFSIASTRQTFSESYGLINTSTSDSDTSSERVMKVSVPKDSAALSKLIMKANVNEQLPDVPWKNFKREIDDSILENIKVVSITSSPDPSSSLSDTKPYLDSTSSKCFEVSVIPSDNKSFLHEVKSQMNEGAQMHSTDKNVADNEETSWRVMSSILGQSERENFRKKAASFRSIEKVPEGKKIGLSLEKTTSGDEEVFILMPLRKLALRENLRLNLSQYMRATETWDKSTTYEDILSSRPTVRQITDSFNGYQAVDDNAREKLSHIYFLHDFKPYENGEKNVYEVSKCGIEHIRAFEEKTFSKLLSNPFTKRGACKSVSRVEKAPDNDEESSSKNKRERAPPMPESITITKNISPKVSSHKESGTSRKIIFLAIIKK